MLKKILYGLLPSILFITCHQPFEPNGPYDGRMVVYSVLRMDTDTQYVRIYETYNPNHQNPLTHTTDTEIIDAVVTISDNTTTVQFHDTLIVRADTTTVYGKYVHAYVAYNFRPAQAKNYTLMVKSPGREPLTTTTKTFVSGAISTVGYAYQTLSSPKFSNPDTAINVVVIMDSDAPVYMVRFMLRYNQRIAGIWVPKEIEVPYYIKEGSRYDDYTPYYPPVMVKGENATGAVSGEELMPFSKEAYIATVRYLKNTIGPSKIEFDGVYFSLSQMDQSLYSYYSVTNRTSESISIRLDQIDYTNISGGYGLFGAITYGVSNYIRLPVEIDVP